MKYKYKCFSEYVSSGLFSWTYRKVALLMDLLHGHVPCALRPFPGVMSREFPECSSRTYLPFTDESSASFSLIRGSETRHVAVSVPLAKLGLTIFHEVKGALERSFIVIRDESFPSKHPQDSYNQPQV